MPELEPAYLIGGSDRPKVEVAVHRLRAHFDPGSIDHFDAAETDGATVVAACNAGTLFGDRRLVLVDQVDGRPGDDGRLRSTWKAAEVAVVVEYLHAPSPGTVLCLVAAEVKKDSALTKAVAKLAKTAVLAYDVSKKDVGKWVTDRFRAGSVRVDPQAVQLLLQLVGERDKHALAQEIDKVITWAQSDGETRIGEREISELVIAWVETPPWELTDAWATHDPAAALHIVERVLYQAGGPQRRRDEAARLAATMGGHLGKLRGVKRAVEAGERPREYAERTKQHQYPVEKLYRQAEGMSPKELDDATVTLARLDLSLKGGSKLSPELELQRAVTALSEDRARHA